MLTHKTWQINNRAFFVPVFFACIFIFSAFLHVKLGMDSFWDTLNYHVFLGWSFVIFQYGEFGAAAQYHSYLNPLIDGINYFSFYTSPYIGAAVHSLFYLLLAYILFKLIIEIIDEDVKLPLLSAVGCIVGITGAMTISLFGSWTNENIVAVPVLTGLYALLRGIKHEDFILLFSSGIFFGVAAGLKLTATHYVVGAFFACLIFFPRIKLVLALIIGLGTVFLLVDGYFMYLRWEFTGNPIFPLANNIFKSPYYPEIWKSFSRFEPSKTLYYLSLPIVWLSSGDFSEVSTVRDPRLLLAYLGVFLILINCFIYRKIDRQKLALSIFFISSFFAWILVFRVYRYLVVLEALSGALFVVGLSCIFNRFFDKLPLLIAVMALPLLWHITYYPDWGRRSWSKDFAASNILNHAHIGNKSIIFFADQRVSYLAPELHRAGINFANLYSQHWWDGRRGMDPIDSDHSVDPIRLNISEFENIYFLQYSKIDPRNRSKYLTKIFSNHYYKCVEIKTNILWSPYLCQFKEFSNFPKLKTDIEYSHFSDKIYFENGWSNPEPTHRWSDGKKSTLYFRINEDSICSLYSEIKGFTLGNQFVEVLVNSDTVFSDRVNGYFSKVIPIPTALIKNGLIKLEFLLPEARVPENGDPRVLALALQSIKVSCEK